MKIFIVGAGEVGFHIAGSLTQEGHDLVVIDLSSARVHKLESQLDVLAVCGDGANAEILKLHGVENADLLFAVSNSDTVNLLSSVTARRLGARKCVTRLSNPYHGGSPLLQDDPAILPLYPERLVAEEIFGLTKVPGVTKALFFEGGKLLLIRVRPSDAVDIYGKPLRDLRGPEGWVLVGVQDLHMQIPRGDTVLERGQRIYAVGRPETVGEFLQAIGVLAPPIREVLIAGAGQVGAWLAKQLVQEKVKVTLIQRQYQKALALATEVPEALVLEGDATDLSLLREAGVETADLFVGATQDDETNVISSFLARESGARTVVSLYQRPEFLNVLRAARVDSALSPRLVTAGTILRMVHRREILSLDLVGRDAEVVEFEVPPRSKILKGPLRKLKLPNDAIVGAVVRGEDHHVPGGDFRFEVGDRALVFSLSRALPALEKMFRGK